MKKNKEDGLTKIKTIGVVGAGTMGSGIALTAARSGYMVILRDLREELLERSRQLINNSLHLEVEKGRLTESEKKKLIAKIRTTVELDPLRESDFIIEAIAEDINEKRELFSNLDSMLLPAAIIASNTSSLSITRLGSATARPDRVVGMHFMNPPSLMKLVEIVKGIATSQETLEIVKNLAIKFGKLPVEVNDTPGFVINRILIPMINEAIFVLQEGVASAEAIDEIMKSGQRHPMGPLQMADFIGLDVCLSIMKVLYESFNDPKYRPCPLLKKYVDAGWLGIKSGKGFYQY